MLVLGAIALAAVSISIVPALSGTITTLDGGAVSEAYIAYRYIGPRFNFVDSLSYYRPGEVLQTDATASFDVPGFLQVHYPLDGRPRIEVLVGTWLLSLTSAVFITSTDAPPEEQA